MFKIKKKNKTKRNKGKKKKSSKAEIVYGLGKFAWEIYKFKKRV